MSFYDPREHGALCDQCVLQAQREGGPVQAEVHVGAQAVIVAEAPGETEVEQGRPLCGKSGAETMDALRTHGLGREHFSWTNSVLCRPPGNNMDVVLHKLQQENSRRKKENAHRSKENQIPLLPTPQQACRPRLLRELESLALEVPAQDGSRDRLLNVVAMGKHSWNALTQGNDAIGSVRGGPEEAWLAPDGGYWKQRWPALDARNPDRIPLHLRIMPSHHAAFVLRSPKWRQAFRGDFGRAFRWWRGQLRWTPPKIWFNPPPNAIREFLARPEPHFGADFETDAREPLVAQIRCLGICDSSGDNALQIHFLSIDGVSHFYNDAEQEEVESICKDFLANQKWRKVGHNFGAYDTIVARARWGVTPANVVDTIIGARLADSEQPKSLAYVASVYTDAPSWKKEKTALHAKTDEELAGYCANDTSADVRALPGLVDAVRRNGQEHIWQFLVRNQAVAVGMHEAGMFVDEAKRREWDAKMTHAARRWLAIARGRAGVPGINPNSTVQLRDLLFNKWQLPAEEFTKLGDPSTADEVLRRMLKGSSTLTREQKLMVRALRKFRRASKLRGTFIVPLRPSSEFALWDITTFNADEAEEEGLAGEEVAGDQRSDAEKERDSRNEPKPGRTLADGRVHADYNIAPTSLRYSSSGPNCQNFVKKMRNMIRAAPGNILVGVDQGQLELRVAAAIWDCAQYIEAFRAGGDPHLVTCKSVYGSDFETKYGPEMREKLRAFAKRFVYSILYGASLETVHDTLTSSEDARGNLLFPDLSIRETRVAMRAWLGANPEIARGWEGEVNFFRQHGYLEDPIIGHRRFFRDGEDRNELLNFRCQSTGSIIVHKATHRLVSEFIPFGKWGPGTGLIQQGHDSLVVECPIEQEGYVRRALEICMAQPVPELPNMTFKGDAKSAMTWDKV